MKWIPRRIETAELNTNSWGECGKRNRRASKFYILDNKSKQRQTHQIVAGKGLASAKSKQP